MSIADPFDVNALRLINWLDAELAGGRVRIVNGQVLPLRLPPDHIRALIADRRDVLDDFAARHSPPAGAPATHPAPAQKRSEPNVSRHGSGGEAATHLRVYLAGKISQNWWRARLVGRDLGSDGPWPELEVAPGVAYVGPYTVGEEHDGWRHDRSHGTGSMFWTSDVHVAQIRESIVDRCRDAIGRAHFVVAVLQGDAHGTIAEVGYAVALGKSVILCGADDCDKPTVGGGDPIDETWFARLLATSAGAVARCCVKHWFAHATAVVAEYARCESPIEQLFLGAIRRHATLASFTPNVTVLGGRYRIDFADQERKVGVELDGYEWHSSKEAFVADRRRDRDLTAAGWRLLRFAGAEVNADPDDCARQLLAWLDQDASRQPAPKENP